MSYEKELLEVAIYQCGKLTPNEEDRLYKWIKSLILAKRKADEYEAKAKAFDRICEAMDYHYPSENDRKYLNGYQHPKASLKDIDAIINSYESGESNELRE